MESLSEVSEFLNNLEGIMKEDEVNFVERMEELVKNWKPRLWKGMISCTMSQNRTLRLGDWKEEIVEEEVAKIIEEGLPKKMGDPENYIVPLKVNDTTPINALADTEASGIMTIDDGVVNHVYHVKKRNKVLVEEDPEDDEDKLDVFEVGRDEKGYPKYGPTLPPADYISWKFPFQTVIVATSSLYQLREKRGPCIIN
ncbi:hypothetical protein Tco_1406582 [Tanacetum coccineum]